MKSFVIAFACVVGCQPAISAAPAVVSIAPAAPSTSLAPSPPAPRAPHESVVVTGTRDGGLALWRPFATGEIDEIPFPWAKLSIIDSLAVSPDGRDVAYVEGGSKFGPLVVRALAGGSKTLVSAYVAGSELLVVAWSPDERKVLYATRRAGQLRSDCHFSGCPGAGPSSYFVFDRGDHTSTKIDVPSELAAWLDTGDVVVADDDGALERIDHGTKTSLASAYRHDDFMLDVAGHRLLSTGWNETAKHSEVLALDLTTWKETTLAPPARYATYHWPSASPSGKRIAWLATTYGPHTFAEGLVVDGVGIVAPTRELVGFTWIDDHALVAHYANRIDVVDANDGSVKGSKATNADDTMR